MTIRDYYAAAARLDDAGLAAAKQAVMSASKADLDTAFKQEGFRMSGTWSREKLAKFWIDAIVDRNGSYKRSKMTGPNRRMF